MKSDGCIPSRVSLVQNTLHLTKIVAVAGEMNGKSGNINNVCAHLYPPGTRVPGSELVCVFDSDQVASKEFFMKTVPLFDGGMLVSQSGLPHLSLVGLAKTDTAMLAVRAACLNELVQLRKHCYRPDVKCALVLHAGCPFEPCLPVACLLLHVSA